MQHGTNGTYTKHACRCDPCTEAHRVYNLEYRKTESGRAAIKRKNEAYNKRYPERRRAWHLVSRAIQKGTLIRPTECEECQATCKPDASHHDYEKPLEVRWLCRQCHTNLDRPDSIRNELA